MRADWQQLLDDMDAIEKKAVTVQGHLHDVTAAAQTAGTVVAAATIDVTTVLASLARSASSSEQQVTSSMSAIGSSTASARDSISTAASEMTSQIQGAAASVAAGVASIVDATANVKPKVANRLDDLQSLLSDHTNLWNKAVDEMIDAVRIGAVPIEELLKLYGDAMVNGERVRDFLKGLDLHQYVAQVDELSKGLYDGSVKISQVTDFLGSTQLLFAKQIADTIKLFQQGKVTLEQVRTIIEGIKNLFPTAEFADLAKAIEDALAKGQL